MVRAMDSPMPMPSALLVKNGSKTSFNLSSGMPGPRSDTDNSAKSSTREVRKLMMRQLDPAAPIMKAVGVRELAAHLRGELPLAEAVALAQQETRRYAKRQMTWFRNQTPDWPRLAGEEDSERFLASL